MSGRESVTDWLWLQDALGVSASLDAALEFFQSPGEIRASSERELRLSGVFSAKEIEKLRNASPDNAKKIEEICFANGWKIITPESDLYPVNLRRIHNFPAAIYCMGSIDGYNDKLCLASVGARSASRYGKAVAYAFCKQFAQAGAVTVSGGAVGIDTASHRGAMDGNGKTAAFLGCGFGTNYLPENKELRERISQNGALLTEFPPYTMPNRYSFPIRNRLISGMCSGTVVIEAGEKSGSLITARTASEQGRDVFAVPGDIVSSSYTGANKLIRGGARAVFSGIDVLEEYRHIYTETLDLSAVMPMDLGALAGDIKIPAEEETRSRSKSRFARTPKKETAKHENAAVFPKTLPEDEKQLEIYNLLLENGEMHVDEIAARLGKRSFEVLSQLTRLEISGFIEINSGRLCKIKSE